MKSRGAIVAEARNPVFYRFLLLFVPFRRLVLIFYGMINFEH